MNSIVLTHADWRPGSTVECPALVLSALKYQETGKIVQLLTLDHGRITAFAPGAVNSRKRFGAALEPMSFLQAQLKLPREFATGGAMPQLLKADLRDSFLHLRTHSALLDSGIFAVKFVQEFVPEGSAEPTVFRALGRFLRDSAKLSDPTSQAPWARFAFWNWLSVHFGFGDLAALWDGDGGHALPSVVQGAWSQLMAQSEPVFVPYFEALTKTALPALTRSDEVFIYSKWTESSGMHWPDFERWLQCSLV